MQTLQRRRPGDTDYRHAGLSGRGRKCENGAYLCHNIFYIIRNLLTSIAIKGGNGKEGERKKCGEEPSFIHILLFLPAYSNNLPDYKSRNAKKQRFKIERPRHIPLHNIDNYVNRPYDRVQITMEHKVIKMNIFKRAWTAFKRAHDNSNIENALEEFRTANKECKDASRNLSSAPPPHNI